MNLTQYVQILNTRYQTGISREHSYRGDLQTLLSALLPDVLVTNEPARIECGAPDYILTKKDIPVGYIEAKDIGIDLASKSLKEQFDRYRASLNNLIFTDYLDFHFYKDGLFVTKVAIAGIQGGKIIALPDNFDTFNSLIKNFAATISQTIKSPTKLAEMMAGRAKLMADVIEKALNADDEHKSNSALKGQMQTFKTVLIHDITNRAFADLYAQTIAYGMFAARYHDPTLPTFSRQEAATLIPKTNPFLRRLFQDIAGFDLDDRLVWIVDELVQIFLSSDVADIMRNFGNSTKQEDPVIHFYETFLAAYDPALRKARGVWYTPEPVVSFIVRAVDDILKTEFGLAQGLADTSKTKIKTKVSTKATADARSKVKEVEYEREVHKVQILDPATGTGTFLAEVVRRIHKKFASQQGIWSNYVENNLIPRLHGFEILMASYAMAHLKLDLLLTETGYKPTKDQRFRVYLTNSLEESHPDTGTLFASWLSDEANEANQVKRDTPVMVVLGNPPYNGESSNKEPWIMDLMKDYKKEPGGGKLKEKNSKWINNDYVKFIRFGQYFIDQNEAGILAYVNSNSFLAASTLRGVRWHLLQSFDIIYIIDLHGNANNKEMAPGNSLDQNVFDIMEGVCINLFIKTGKKKKGELAKVLHFDLYGKRDKKYDFLSTSNIKDIPFVEIKLQNPQFYFYKQENSAMKPIYDEGFAINELFSVIGNGIVTKRDNLCISDSEGICFTSAKDILELPKPQFFQKYKLPKDVRDWRYEWAYQDIHEHGLSMSYVKTINYRPFDKRFIYYTGRSRGFVGWPVEKIMGNYLRGNNIGILVSKAFRDKKFAHVFITTDVSEAIFLSSLTGSNAMNAPLYLYPATSPKDLFSQRQLKPNLNEKIINTISERLGIAFESEAPNIGETGFTPFDIFDYTYAVLHSPSYRENYYEFLKTDFPRVPYPKDAAIFWALVSLGCQLRQVHLLESPTVENYVTQYPADGDNVVRKVRYEAGNVYINETQYFANVPPDAWEFYIGGYQPAQKWLKDRKDRELSFEDILHYQKIIVALMETDRIMGEVDKVGVL